MTTFPLGGEGMCANSRVLLVILTVMIITAPVASASMLDESVLYLSSARVTSITLGTRLCS